MCEFKSAIVTRDGRLWHSEFTDAHENIRELYDLHEGSPEMIAAKGPNFVRVEFRPSWSNPFDLDSWMFCVDEPEVPDWFTDDLRVATIAELRSIVGGMLISTGTHSLVCGRTVIVGGDAVVNRAWFCRIFVLGKATVTARDNAKVEAWDKATVTARGNATVTVWDNATVKAWYDAKVEAWDNATVKACDDARVTAWGNATVKAWDDATVEARDNATVKAWDDARVTARDNATVTARNNAKVVRR